METMNPKLLSVNERRIVHARRMQLDSAGAHRPEDDRRDTDAITPGRSKALASTQCRHRENGDLNVRSARPRRSVLGRERRTVGQTADSVSKMKVLRGHPRSPLVVRTDEERDLHAKRGQRTRTPGHPLTKRVSRTKWLLQVIVPCVLRLRTEKH